MIDMRVFVVALLAALVLAASLVLRSCGDETDALPDDAEIATAEVKNQERDPADQRTPEVPPEPPEASPEASSDPAEARARQIESARLANVERLRAIVQAARDTLEAPVYFNFAGVSIRADQQRLLRRKAAILLNSPEVTIRIEGRTSYLGHPAHNVELGNWRARSVRGFLLGLGVPEDRIEIAPAGIIQLAEQAEADRESRARHQEALEALLDAQATMMEANSVVLGPGTQLAGVAEWQSYRVAWSAMMDAQQALLRAETEADRDARARSRRADFQITRGTEAINPIS